MLGLKIFKRKRNIRRDNFEVIKQRISHNQEAVYNALVELNRPASGRMVAAHLGWDSASVTNRLSELRKKGRIQVRFKKVGLDGIRRNFYEATR